MKKSEVENGSTIKKSAITKEPSILTENPWGSTLKKSKLSSPTKSGAWKMHLEGGKEDMAATNEFFST